LLQGKQFAVDAEALMRSRYTAYVLGDAAYLRRSWHPDTCPADLSLDAGVQWLGLKIERHTRISPTHAEVVFIARYRLDGRVYRLAEHSRFVLEQGRWLYCEALA
jgi:SEC-C motif-containing protein